VSWELGAGRGEETSWVGKELPPIKERTHRRLQLPLPFRSSWSHRNRKIAPLGSQGLGRSFTAVLRPKRYKIRKLRQIDTPSYVIMRYRDQEHESSHVQAMPDTSPHMPLSTAELQALAEFARFVDQCSSARNQLRAAPSLEQVIEAAEWFGFSGLSTNLLLRAQHHLHCTGWLWQQSKQRWRDQLFVLSLTNLITSQLQSALPPAADGADGSPSATQSGCL